MLLDAKDQALGRSLANQRVDIADLHQAGLTNHLLRPLLVQGLSTLCNG
jgi:hypothetical protein